MAQSELPEEGTGALNRVNDAADWFTLTLKGARDSLSCTNRAHNRTGNRDGGVRHGVVLGWSNEAGDFTHSTDAENDDFTTAGLIAPQPANDQIGALLYRFRQKWPNKGPCRQPSGGLTFPLSAPDDCLGGYTR